MSRRFMLLFGLTLGSVVGGYVPCLWGDDGLSFTGVLTGAVGAIVGVWVAYRYTE